MADKPENGGATAAQRPTALRDALRLAARGGKAAFGSDTSIITVSDSPSEEDYDELRDPPADAMVLRQRRKPARQDTDDKSRTHAQSPLKAVTQEDGDASARDRRNLSDRKSVV